MNALDRTITRRTLLRGLGTAVTLPFLESLFPRSLLGADAAAKLAAAPGPRRIAWLYVPNGIHMPAWKPVGTGPDFELTPTLQPLAAFKDKLNVVTGLVCDKANPNGDGAGDHARSQSAYLTGVQPLKTGGANLRIGISADQVAAGKIGHLTKFPSLELGLEGGNATGNCDQSYSCLYSHNLSWRNENTPVTKDINPQSVFDRLFANGDPRETAEARARRENDRKSVLDFVLPDAKSLQSRLAAADRVKMDQYLTSVREIEQRIARNATEAAAQPPAGVERPVTSGAKQNLTDYPDRARLMLDMMVLAFQADLTRVITFPFADEGSDQQYAFADANVKHHTTSHHMNDAEKQALLQKINLWHIKQVAYVLGKLDAIKESNGSILDNSLIAYGSGNSDGNRHNHDDLPFLLLGKGGGTVTGNRHLIVNRVPTNNMWLSMLDRLGAGIPRLGDSTGRFALS